MANKYAAKIVLVNEDGQILMLRNSATHDWAAGKLDLPGGIIEAGESPTQAVMRELREEAGVRIDSENVTLAYSSTNFFQDTNYVLFLYTSQLSKDTEITLNFEHDEFSWLSTEDAMEKYEHSAYRAGLLYLVDHNLLHS